MRGWRAHAQNGVILYALSRAFVIFPRYKLLETDDCLGSLHTSVDRKDVWLKSGVPFGSGKEIAGLLKKKKKLKKMMTPNFDESWADG